MSTTVTYKGSTLTTVNNNTKTLKTAGKYMEGDVQLTDVSSTIVVSETYDTNGGIIKTIATTDEVNLQAKTITPTTSIQTVNPDTGYDGFSQVIVNAGGGGTTINNQDKTVNPSISKQTINADSGYTGLGTVTVNAMPSGTAGTPSATKGTVSNHSVTVTPSVTNSTGYIDGGTKTGTAVTVSASELASGNKAITQNGTNIDVVGYSTVSVDVQGGGGGYVWQDENGYVHLSDEDTDGLIVEGLTVTQNGTYTASSGRAYSPITVNVPTGGNYPIFTLDVSQEQPTVTCDKTYAECRALINQSNFAAVVDVPLANTIHSGQATFYQDGYPYITYEFYRPQDGLPYASVVYYENRIEYYTNTSDSLPNATQLDHYGTQKGTINRSTSVQYLNIPVGAVLEEKYYTIPATPDGTVSTPTATKGTVSNHSVSITPSVTSATGYITGGTKTGTAVTVSASELVSGTYTVDSSGTKDVTNYASALVPAGTAGTPSASKGTVFNHSVSVTPSVTNTTGWITGSTKTGTAVTVSASELVSGSETKTENGTYDVTNLAELIVNVSGGGSGGSGGLVYETGTLTLSSDESTPIISFTNTHTDVPIYVNITDVTETLATDNSNLYWTFMNWHTAFDTTIKTTSSANLYGRYQYGWKTSSGASAGNVDCTNTGTGSGSLYYLVESTRFGPYCGSTSRYWRTGRTYKWIAVWAPVDPADIPLNVQLIDYTKVTSGYVVDGDTGQETASQWSSCSDYVLIDPTMTFSYIGYRWYDIVFFDSNKGYISSLYMDDDKDSVTNDYAYGTITPAKIPSTAKYVRISSYPTNPNNTQLSLIRTA